MNLAVPRLKSAQAVGNTLSLKAVHVLRIDLTARRGEASNIADQLFDDRHVMAFGRRGFLDELNRHAVFLALFFDRRNGAVLCKPDGGHGVIGHFGWEHPEGFFALGDVIPDLFPKRGTRTRAAENRHHIIAFALADDDLFEVRRLDIMAARIDHRLAACQ